MTAPMGGHRIVSIQTTDERGGAEYANIDLLHALHERGHDVVLLTDMPDLAAGTGVPVRAIDIGPKLARRSAALVALQAPRTLLRLMRALSAERPVGGVLLHFKKEQLLCSLLPRVLTGEIVWAEWGPVPYPLRKGVGRRCYALAARRASRILAVSEGTRRTILATGVPAAKVKVVPNLVDAESVRFDPAGRERLRRTWGVPEQALVVGCVSRFQRRKRNDVAIDAMAHLDDRVRLVLAGDGEEEAVLRARAAAFGDRVRFEPNVRGHVESFLSACDLLVFTPSPTEGEPRIIVMAQLIGLPVISTGPEGANGLIPPGGGTIVSPAHDPRALAAVIEAYRDDPQRRQRAGELARQAMRESHDPEQTLGSVERALSLEPAGGSSEDGVRAVGGPGSSSRAGRGQAAEDRQRDDHRRERRRRVRGSWRCSTRCAYVATRRSCSATCPGSRGTPACRWWRSTPVRSSPPAPGPGSPGAGRCCRGASRARWRSRCHTTCCSCTTRRSS